MMGTPGEKRAIASMLKDSIIQFCRASGLFGGRLSIDGIVCISGSGEGQEVVVKLHETLGFDSKYSELNGRDHAPDEVQDLRKKRRLEDSAYDDGSPEYSEMSMEQDEDDGVRDLSMTRPIVITPENGESRSSLSPPEGRFVGTSMFNAGNMSYFFPKRSMMRHERWSPNQPIPTVPECKHCGLNFNSFDLLQDHNEAIHSLFTCQSCFKTFTSRSNLERHSRLHTGHKPYTCNICGKSFSRKDHLSNHATKHAFKCGTCSKRFSDKKMLVTHYQFDHNAVLTNICDYCNKGFSNPDAYEEHVKTHPQYHGEPAPPSPRNTPSPVNLKKNCCSRCGFSSSDPLTLAKHSVIHKERGQRCFTCLACAKTFDDPLNYCDHLLVHQNEVNIFECVICRHLCSTLQSLRRHEANHVPDCFEEMDTDYGLPNASSTPRYTCYTCNKTFASHLMLREHMELHLDLHLPEKPVMPFSCPTCSEEFDSHMEMSLHMERDHHVPADSRSNKRRKQNCPKPLQLKTQPAEPPKVEVAQEEPELEEDEDYEIVEPQSPDDDLRPLEIDERKTDENCNKVDRPTVVEQNHSPVRSLLFGRPAQEPVEPQNLQTSRNTSPVESSQPATPAATPTATPSRLANVEIPPGPYSCSICQHVSKTFQDLEMHCFSEHNRSPCMFCSKTFAQKANRDRHVCLHTGQKPYACPECDERFSRGDKLKLHRTRVHKIQFPAYTVKKESTNGPEEEKPSDKPVSLWGKEDQPSGDESWPVSLVAKKPVMPTFGMGERWGESIYKSSESVYQGGEMARVGSPRTK